MSKQNTANWLTVKSDDVSDIVDYVANGSFESLAGNVKVMNNDGFAVLVRLKDFNNKFLKDLKFVDESSYKFLKKSSLSPGDLFVSNVGNPGLCFVVPEFEKPMTLGPNGVRLRVNDFYNKFFLKYFLESPQGKELLKRIITGTAQQKFNKTDFRNLYFPLPTLPEQQRIVSKLNNLFAEIEVINKALKKIPQLLQMFKQDVLSLAISGELSRKWREANGISKAAKGILADVIENIESGKSFNCLNIPVTAGNVGLVKISAVTWGFFDEVETKTVVEIDKINERLFIKKGDFLISRANTLELVGAPVIVGDIHNDIMLNDKVWRVLFRNWQTKFYVMYFLKSSLGRKEIQAIASGNQLSMRNISKSNFKTISLDIPALEEQEEIIRLIESLFAKADKIEAQYKTLKQKIDSLPQAILHKAFKGELVEQLPTDGDAKDLLAEIKRLKIK
ncbi:restriction endonuclease subunit S [Pedobacter aquatilis]|uniref:restriction endonuclease subunit S n=1 Tax=Pedobacter aquatilis TaxID=351343 RepID=UPI0029307B0D|nr:restriction endonuclease subunit S [Pedobacter aquatilis]